MQLKDLVHEWMQKARQDLDSAKFLSNMKPLPKNIIGFRCQQAQQAVEHRYPGEIDVDESEVTNCIQISFSVDKQSKLEKQ
jgi:hypothetical protein